jgi:AraC-like DNA-binding protein
LSTNASLRLAMQQATVASIKQYVEAHLYSSELSAASICARAGWSRATMYRLFETEGGLVSYVQQQRLRRAFLELVGAGPRRRMLDIALESHFASEATFSRAFRRTFGLSPREARMLGAPAHRAGPPRGPAQNAGPPRRHYFLRGSFSPSPG